MRGVHRSDRRGNVATRVAVTALFTAAPLLGYVLPAAADAAADFPACTREPTPADIEGAAGSHRAAKAFYERADYDKAIQLWRDAYNFDCTKPAVFLNVANAYEKKGDKASAIAMLELYLARAPKDAPDLGTIATKVNNLKSALKATETAPPPTTTTADATPPASAPPPAPSAGGADKTSQPGERPFGLLPWIPVGIGAGAAIAGAILLPIGIGMESDAESACPSRKGCKHDVVDEGNAGIRNQRIGGVLLALGAVGVAGGLVWQFVFNQPRAASASIRVSPAVGGVSVAGTF